MKVRPSMIKKSYIKLICLLLCSSFLLYGCGLFSKSVDDNSSENNIQGTLAIFEPSSQPNAAMAMSMSISNLAMNISGELANLADATVCVVDIITHIKVPGIECVQSDSDGQFVLPVLDSITVDSQLIRAIKGDKIITSIIDTSQETVNGDPFTTATVAKVMALIEENDSAEFLSGENLAFDPVKKSAFLTSIKSLSEAVKIEIEKISPEDINDFTTLPSVQAEGTEVDSTIFKSFITDSSSLTIASDDITSLKTMMQSIQSEFIETVTIMKEDGTVETIDDKKTRVAEAASTETDTDTSLDTSSTDTSTSDTSTDTSTSNTSTDTSTSNTSTDSTDDSSTTPTNLAATDITLSNMSIAENEAANTVIGTITITDDGVGTNSLTLTGTDSGKFTLDGTTLKTAEPFDYEANSSYTITLTATDGSLVFSKDLTITITDVAEVIAPEPLIMVFSMTAGEELFLPWAAPAITEADIDYEVDWGDDSAVEQKGLSHTYASADSYEVTITHKENKRIPNIKFHSSGNDTSKLNLTELKKWGTNKWTSLKFAFMNCSNLTTISETDAPDLSNLSDSDPLRQLFEGTAMNSNVNHWDVSQVQSFNGVFRALSTFNNGCAAGDTSCPLTWDVSSATNMNFMFLFANNFNQNISNWDVSQVTSMSSMLKGTTSFNQNISEWDVSNVTNFTQIFTDSGLAGNEPCWFDGSPNAPCD